MKRRVTRRQTAAAGLVALGAIALLVFGLAGTVRIVQEDTSPFFAAVGDPDPIPVPPGPGNTCPNGYSFSRLPSGTGLCVPDDPDRSNTADNDENNTADDNDSSNTSGGARTFKIKNPLKSESFIELIDNILTALIVLAAPIAVIVVVYAGFLYTTSGGNPEKVKKATRTITYAAVGIAIILLSKGIVVLVDDVLKGGGQGETEIPPRPEEPERPPAPPPPPPLPE